MKPPCALDRRTFLKELSVLAAGCAALPLNADAQDHPQGATVWKRAPCQLCGVGCGLLVGIQNGRAVAVKGDPDSPVNRGLACVKGYHSVQSLYGRDRITRPSVRRGGALVEVPMSEALDLVARQLQDSLSKHGPDSIAIYGSPAWTISDQYTATKFFQQGLGSRNIVSGADGSGASAQVGLESSFGLAGSIGCHEDIDHADVFVIWNQNIAETDPILFSRMLERRRVNPAVKIIDLSTRSTRTSYAADRSLLFTPQSELAIANALCQEIIVRDWHDRDFIDRQVAFKRGRTDLGPGLSGEPSASDDTKDATFNDYVKFLEDYAPERAQQLSGLAAEDIRWLASLYGDPARKVMSVWGAGVNAHARGTWLNNLIYNIHLLVGKIAEPGSNPFALVGQPPPRSTTDSTASTPARSPLSVFRALESGAVRFLWVQGANPLAELPNLQRYRKAAATADRFMVVSAEYPSATTVAADVVLPAALWIEREGLTANAERRIQHFDRMLAPPGEALSYTAQLIEIARRTGQNNRFPPGAAASIEKTWDEIRRAHPQPAERLPTLAQLRDAPGVIWPVVNGRETRRRYRQVSDPAADRVRGEFDFYGHADHRAWIWLRPYQPPPESPDREYPFWLTTGEVLEHTATGALTRRIPTLHAAVPHAYVEINRQDAERLGIRNGEMVQLVSRRGLLRIEARIDYRAQPIRGHVFVTSFDEMLPINRLTLDASCPLSGQAAGTCAVRVERLPARGGQ